MEGTPFGRYVLVELIGRGGMGEVWRAYDSDTERIVAIKVLPAHYSDNEDFTQRFRREAHAAARLNTPHVIPIHHFGEIDGRLYVDMRLIEGSDLQTVLADGPIEPARAVRIVEQIAMALQAAHEAGLLHRDVKPSNILLDRHDFAYLIDFGIARAADETRLTKSGNTIGTFHYIAPERLGTDTEDARADVYSLTCVLYECLTGSPPFDEPTMARLVAAHLSAPPPKPSSAEPKVPARIDRVIETGMAKNPEDRYSTTVELAQAAREAVAAPTTTPDATVYAFASSPSGAEQSTMVADRTPIDPEPARQERTRTRTTLIATIAAATVIVVAAIGITTYLSRPQPADSATQTTPAAAPAETPAPMSPPPITDTALDGLLLSPVQVDAALGATGMSLQSETHGLDDNDYFATNENPACHSVTGPANAWAYNGSGWTAVRRQRISNTTSDAPDLQTGLVDQAVVLVPSARDADSFRAGSARLWPSCRQFTLRSSSGESFTSTVGPVTDSNGVLSVTKSTAVGSCQRALTVANNVVIDVAACTVSQSLLRADAAVVIAQQIAARVPNS